MQSNDWKTLAQQLNSNAHGHIHELVGGSWNPTEHLRTPPSSTGAASSAFDKDWRTSAYQFAHGTESFSKVLWRYGYLRCPEAPALCALPPASLSAADAAAQAQACRCVCTPETFQNMSVPHLLASTGITKALAFIDKVTPSVWGALRNNQIISFHFPLFSPVGQDGNPIEAWQNRTSKVPYDVLPGYSAEESAAIFDRILEVLCNPGYIGDMFQASSTNDVTFWILHPTLDRLWHFTRLNDRAGRVSPGFDHTWPDSPTACPGHLEHDATPFKNLFDGNDTVYTNAQLYTLMDPARDAFPYVYDHFLWTHCTHLGYDMSGSTVAAAAATAAAAA